MNGSTVQIMETSEVPADCDMILWTASEFYRQMSFISGLVPEVIK